MGAENEPAGTGPTAELSLRVSVATLVRVVFPHPVEGKLHLALERQATLLEQDGQEQVLIKSQPFGGALHLRNLLPLQRLVGQFHFDSQHSHSERDFRLFIRPADWNIVKEFCLEEFDRGRASTLESDPSRELAEEFTEALGVDLRREQFTCRSVRVVVEDYPWPTENSYARGYRTVRLYRIFEARLLDPTLCHTLVENNRRISDQDLRKQATQNARRGGKGWASAVLTLPLDQVRDFYLALSPQARSAPVVFGNHLLDETISTVLEGVCAPKYRIL